MKKLIKNVKSISKDDWIQLISLAIILVVPIIGTLTGFLGNSEAILEIGYRN